MLQIALFIANAVFGREHIQRPGAKPAPSALPSSDNPRIASTPLIRLGGLSVVRKQK